jgi:microcystin-dependent protein
MSQPLIGEVRVMAFESPPTGWEVCDGRLMAIATYPALFDTIGTTYGGDGDTTFALPNLTGRAAIGAGTGPGLSAHAVGASGGAQEVALTAAEMPSHTHAARGYQFPGRIQVPGPTRIMARSSGGSAYDSDTTGLVGTAAGSLTEVGADQAHNNMPPSLAMTFVIALAGEQAQAP